MGVWGKCHRDKVPFSSRHLEGTYHHDLLLLMLTLISWLKSWFLHCSYSPLPTLSFPYCSLWKEVPVSSPRLRNRRHAPLPLRVEYIQTLSGTSLGIFKHFFLFPFQFLAHNKGLWNVSEWKNKETILELVFCSTYSFLLNQQSIRELLLSTMDDAWVYKASRAETRLGSLCGVRSDTLKTWSLTF